MFGLGYGHPPRYLNGAYGLPSYGHPSYLRRATLTGALAHGAATQQAMLMQNTMLRQAATQNAMLNHDLALGNRYAMGMGLGYPAGGIPVVHIHIDPYYISPYI